MRSHDHNNRDRRSHLCALSLAGAVLQMEAKRANGSPAILFVDAKTQMIVDVDFST